MLRKFMAAALAVFLTTGAWVSLRAANIPLFSPATNPTAAACEEASQTLNCLNSLINQINSGVAGYYAAVMGPITSIATTAQQTLASIVVPTSTISAPGQSLRIRCYGTTSSDAIAGTGTKNIVLAFGSNSITTGAFGNTGTADPWELELLITASNATGASVAVGRGSIATGTSATPAGVTVTPTATNDLVDLLNAAQTVSCKDTSGATTASATLEGLYIEQVK